MPPGPQPACQDRDPTPRPGPETQSVHPPAVHSRRRRLPGGSLRNAPAPVFCGRAAGADAPSAFSSFQRRCDWQAKRAGGRPLSPSSRPPAVARLAASTAGERAQSMRRSPPAPNPDRRGSCPRAFGRGLVRASGGERLQLDTPGSRSPGSNQFPQISSGSARPPGGRGRRPFCS